MGRRTAERIERKGPCRVFWASHGCRKPRGHIGRHWCRCGERCPDQVALFGDDVFHPDARSDKVVREFRSGVAVPFGPVETIRPWPDGWKLPSGYF